MPRDGEVDWEDPRYPRMTWPGDYFGVTLERRSCLGEPVREECSSKQLHVKPPGELA